MRILVLAILALGLCPDNVRAQEAEIVVTASGQVSAAPDRAEVSMGVSHQGASAQEVMARVRKDAESILARLATLGVAAEHVQTSHLSLSPIWQHDRQGQSEPRLTGYRGGTNFSVLVTDLPKLGAILDQVLDSGATQLSGVQFLSGNADGLRRDAARVAVANALLDAQAIAESAGGTLGPVRSIRAGRSETGGPVPMRMAEAAIPIAAGSLDFTAQVTVTFAFSN